MRAILTTMLLVTVLGVCGCGHQREIDDFSSQLYDATSDMTKTIDAMPSADGVSIASAEFNRKYADLHKLWNKILSERLTKQDKSDLSDAVFRSREKLTECFTRHTPEFQKDKEFWEALGLARTGLEAQFKVEEIYPTGGSK